MNDEKETLAEKLMLDQLPDADAAKITADVADAVFANVAARAAAELSSQNAKELIRMIDAGASAQLIHEFLRHHISHFDQLVAEESARLIATIR